jgi:hypothetical protein
MMQTYTERQINLPPSITGCTQPYKEICRFAAAAGAILMADFIGYEYIITELCNPHGVQQPG